MQKLNNILSKIVHILTPLMILIYTCFLYSNYSLNNNLDSWNSLSLFGSIIILTIWIVAIYFTLFLFNNFFRQSFTGKIIKIMISILNIFIWINNANFFLQNDMLIILNIMLVVINGIYNSRPNMSVKNNKVQISCATDQSNQGRKVNLYKLFTTISILICILLPFFVDNMTSKFDTSYNIDEFPQGVISFSVANQIAVYVWPVLILYLVMLFILVMKKVNYRKVYYPLSLLTLTVFLFNLSIIYWGYAVILFVIILIYPIVILIISSSIIGNKLDNSTITIRNALLTFGTISVIVLAFLTLFFIPNINFKKADEFINTGEEIKEPTNNENVQKKNKLIEELNNLLDNSFASVSHLILNEDYSTIRSVELLIITDNVPGDVNEFCNKLIDSYDNIKSLLDKYAYSSETIQFKFTDENPFSKEESTHYANGGYIKINKDLNLNSNRYLIYLNPTPITIK